MFMKGFLIASVIALNVFCVNAQDKPQLVVTTGHHESIRTVAYSGNGRYVASGGSDKILKIYDLNLQQEFNSIAGFGDEIAEIKFSTDSKYIFVFSGDHIYTYSHPGGNLLHKTDSSEIYEGNVGMCYIGTNDKIYIPNNISGVVVYDPVKGVVEKTWPDIDADHLVYIKSQNLIAGRDNDDEDADKYSIYFYDATSGELKKNVVIDGGFGDKIAVDKNEEKLAFEYVHGKLDIIDLKTFTISNKFDVVVGPIAVMSFYPDGKKMICIGYDCKPKIYEVASGKMTMELSVETMNAVKSTVNYAIGMMGMDFSPDGKTLAIAYNCIYENYSAYRVGYYSTDDFKLKHKYDGQNKICVGLFTDKEESRLAVGNFSRPIGPRVWNLKKGELESFHIGDANLKAGGDKLIMYTWENTDLKNHIRVFELSTMKLLRDIKIDGNARLAISEDGKYIAAFILDFSKGTPVVSFVGWETETGKELFNKPGSIADHPMNLCFTPNNEFLVCFRDRFERFEMPSGKLIKSIQFEKECPFTFWTEFDASGKEMFFGILLGNGFDIRSMNIETGAITTHVHEEKDGAVYAIKFSPDHSKLAIGLVEFGSENPFKVFLYDWATKTKIKTFDEFTAMVFQICFGPKTGNMYFGDNNGVITIVGPDFTKKSTLLAANEKDYMIVSPEYYYKTSITNTEGIAFRYKDELYRFDQFDLKFNRPDIVMEKMGIISETQVAMYKDAYVKRLKRLGYDENTIENGTIHSPAIGITSKENIPFTTSSPTVKFTVWSSDSLFDLKRMAIYVNNIPLYGKSGLSLDPKTRKYQKEIEILLEEGKNKIAVSFFNEVGVESVRESFVTECTQKFAKPDLYILAVGVSKYQDSTMNLTYSDKDVKDITAIFNDNNKVSGRFANVFVKLITNEEATVTKIDEAAAILQNSKVNDQVVLFFSGHGLIDQQMDYYLATNPVDFLNPSKDGLLYTHFQDYFDGLKCRKRLLLIDACHSGEFDKADFKQDVLASNTTEQVNEKDFKFRGKKVIGIANTNDLMKELFTDLRKETGATVIASSSGTEFSVESSTWKNGAFTYALKEGLALMKADGNKNKEITLSETRNYVIAKVKELTAGRQNPTTRQENIDFDYRLW